MGILTQLAHGAVALLIAALAIYLALRLLGKIAKFVVALIVVAVLVWIFVTNDGLMQYAKELIQRIPALLGR